MACTKEKYYMACTKEKYCTKHAIRLLSLGVRLCVRIRTKVERSVLRDGHIFTCIDQDEFQTPSNRTAFFYTRFKKH